MQSLKFLDIPALSAVQGVVRLPGSKSITNRVLLLSALCEGVTTVRDMLLSEDTEVMIEALHKLGCHIKELDRTGRSLAITGLNGSLLCKKEDFFLANAGTAVRPLVATLAILGGDFTIRGVPRMHERPIRDLVDALCNIGCDIKYLQNEGFLPLAIGYPQLNLAQSVKVRGDVSSQFLTALLMALPLVSRHDIVIELTSELISKPYIAITLDMMAKFGVDVHNDDWKRFTISVNSRYRSPSEIFVESDASSASYFIAMGAIAASDGNALIIDGLGSDSIQGDIYFAEAACAMGADVEMTNNSIAVRRGSWPLKAVQLDCNHIPDAAMTLAVMALYANGTTRLANIGSWRVKETDRISAMVCELRKLGAVVAEGDDFIEVTPPPQHAWRSASIDTYKDHRMAMCFSLAAFNPDGVTIRINDPACVAKTFPDYFDTFFGLVHAPAEKIPVICIDGPTASGKGTLTSEVASQLGYHFLDSGALYRAAGLAMRRFGIEISAQNEDDIAARTQSLAIIFADNGITLLNGEDVSEEIRSAESANDASKIAALPKVRMTLLQLQRNKRKLPGLVADGRDMGTVVFPDANLKIFLTATPECRAKRRFEQMRQQGFSVTIEGLVAELRARDLRDANRQISPMKPAQDAKLLDNSSQSVKESVASVLMWWRAVQPV